MDIENDGQLNAPNLGGQSDTPESNPQLYTSDSVDPQNTLNPEESQDLLTDVIPSAGTPFFASDVNQTISSIITMSLLGIAVSFLGFAITSYMSLKYCCVEWLEVFVLVSIVIFLILYIGVLCTLHGATQKLSGRTFPISLGRLLGFHFIPIYNFYWICHWPAVFDKFISTKCKSESKGSAYIGMIVLSIFSSKIAPYSGLILRQMVVLMIAVQLSDYAMKVYNYLEIPQSVRSFHFRFAAKKRMLTVMSIVLVFIFGLEYILFFMNIFTEDTYKTANECLQKENYVCLEEKSNQLIEFNPAAGRFYNLRGLAYLEQDKHEIAIKDFDKAIALGPDMYSFHYNRGFSLSRLDRNEEALDEMEIAVKMKPDSAKMLIGRGLVRENMQDYSGALVDYNKALELEPDNSTAKKYKTDVMLYYNPAQL